MKVVVPTVTPTFSSMMLTREYKLLTSLRGYQLSLSVDRHEITQGEHVIFSGKLTRFTLPVKEADIFLAFDGSPIGVTAKTKEDGTYSVGMDLYSAGKYTVNSLHQLFLTTVSSNPVTVVVKEIAKYTLVVGTDPQDMSVNIKVNGVDHKTYDTMTFTEGTKVTVEIDTELPEYRFVRWEDGSTNPVRDIIMNGNMNLVAYFEKIQKPIWEYRVGESYVKVYKAVAGWAGKPPDRPGVGYNYPPLVAIQYEAKTGPEVDVWQLNAYGYLVGNLATGMNELVVVTDTSSFNGLTFYGVKDGETQYSKDMAADLFTAADFWAEIERAWLASDEELRITVKYVVQSPLDEFTLKDITFTAIADSTSISDDPYKINPSSAPPNTSTTFSVTGWSVAGYTNVKLTFFYPTWTVTAGRIGIGTDEKAIESQATPKWSKNGLAVYRAIYDETNNKVTIDFSWKRTYPEEPGEHLTIYWRRSPEAAEAYEVEDIREEGSYTKTWIGADGWPLHSIEFDDLVNGTAIYWLTILKDEME